MKPSMDEEKEKTRLQGQIRRCVEEIGNVRYSFIQKYTELDDEFENKIAIVDERRERLAYEYLELMTDRELCLESLRTQNREDIRRLQRRAKQIKQKLTVLECNLDFNKCEEDLVRGGEAKAGAEPPDEDPKSNLKRNQGAQNQENERR